MKKRHKATRGANNGHLGTFGASGKRKSLPLNWLTKLIESFALYISLTGLIGHELLEGVSFVPFLSSLCIYPERAEAFTEHMPVKFQEEHGRVVLAEAFQLSSEAYFDEPDSSRSDSSAISC